MLLLGALPQAPKRTEKTVAGLLLPRLLLILLGCTLSEQAVPSTKQRRAAQCARPCRLLLRITSKGREETAALPLCIRLVRAAYVVKHALTLILLLPLCIRLIRSRYVVKDAFTLILLLRLLIWLSHTAEQTRRLLRRLCCVAKDAIRRLG